MKSDEASKKQKKGRRAWAKWLLCAFAAVVCLSAVFHLPVLWGVINLKNENPRATALTELRAGEGIAPRSEFAWLPYERISPQLVRAVVAGEDPHFFEHRGFDWDAMGKAASTNLEQLRYARGASTVTQQLAKNLFLSPSKSPTRKLHEALITWELERTLDKRRIMEVYLNVIEWGEGIYGAENAARHYFNVSAADLNEEQAAFLCAMIPNPRGAYNPEINPDRVEIKAQQIRELMQSPALVLTQRAN
ncbi:MAG TPA: monofunctional biosynthetic peptidoglycan transglycosylase [Pyrinomonadaceae bacterium]